MAVTLKYLCIRRLSPQYERRSYQARSKDNAKLALASPLKVNLRILGLIDEEQHILFKTRQLLSYLATLDELRASGRAGRRQHIFGAKFEA